MGLRDGEAVERHTHKPPKMLLEHGIWTIYSYDVGPVPRLQFESLVDAVRAQESGELICWWYHGMPLTAAIDKWNEEVKDTETHGNQTNCR